MFVCRVLILYMFSFILVRFSRAICCDCVWMVCRPNANGCVHMRACICSQKSSLSKRRMVGMPLPMPAGYIYQQRSPDAPITCSRTTENENRRRLWGRCRRRKSDITSDTVCSWRAHMWANFRHQKKSRINAFACILSSCDRCRSPTANICKSFLFFFHFWNEPKSNQWNDSIPLASA